jgi:hypothetical protein
LRQSPDVQSAAAFLLAQFKAALGDRPSLAKADLEQDATLGGLLELFRYADRNADNLLSLKELEDYLRLIDLGMRAQVWITVRDCDRNPFHYLDSDGDGRLSFQERSLATDLLPAGVKELDGLPRQFQLLFGNPPVRSLGGVPIPATPRRSLNKVADTSAAPPWFRAMDRNGDGVISPLEFLGPPEVFRKLDLNGDCMITPDEAVRATSR